MAEMKTPIQSDAAKVFRATRRQFVCVEKTMFPTRSLPPPRTLVVIGGSPITKDLAMELGSLIFGLTTGIWKSSWVKSGFCFRDAESELAFGLLAQKMELKGFMMCVQAYILKQLLFYHAKKAERLAKGRLLKPSRNEQEEILVLAMVDILYKVSQGNKHVTVCLPHEENAYFQEDSEVSTDGVTERLHLFEFSHSDSIQDFLRKYLNIFLEKSGPGCLLFLYSLVLSKGFSKIRDELGFGQEQLLTHQASSSQALINLLLTGVATPYTHNGTVIEEDENCQRQQKIGVVERSEIGLLIWQESDQYGSLLGSRFKTPKLPIWVTNASRQFGILFNPRRELIQDYHAERQFELYYYSSNSGQREIAILSIDTRITRSKDDKDIPLVERLILTKWNEANVYWNGTTPFV